MRAAWVRLAARGVLSIAVLTGGALADEGDCPDYSLHGISLEMAHQEVAQRLRGKRISSGEIAGAGGATSHETYREQGTEIYIEYAGKSRKRERSKVALVRTRMPAESVDASLLLSVFTERFGRPSSGAEHAASGLRSGPMVWVDEHCRARLSVRYLQQSEWWRPGPETIEVELCPPAGGDELFSEPGGTLASLLGGENEVGSPAPTPATAGGAAATKPTPRPPADRLSSSSPEPDVYGKPGESGPAASPRTVSPPPSAGIAAMDVLATASPPLAGVGGVTMPVRLPESYVPPRFPEIAKKLRRTAEVLIEAVIRQDGSVGQIAVIESSHRGMGFEDAAKEAVEQWRYRPATRDDRPVDARITLLVKFL